MNLFKIAWIVFLVLFMGGTGFGFHLYQEQEHTLSKHKKNKQDIIGLKLQAEKSLEQEFAEKEEIEALQDIGKGYNKWWFLQDIEETLGKQYTPLFTSVGPAKIQEKQDYRRLSRQIEVEGGYSELVELLENLEKEKGFSIEKLSIRQSRTVPGKQTASFTLSGVEIKEGIFEQLKDLDGKTEEKKVKFSAESLIIATSWKRNERLIVMEVLSDPFLPPLPEAVKTKVRVKAPEPINLARLGKYKLEGILDFPDFRVAIISPNSILRAGDWLDTKEIISIGKRKVILREGRQEYYLVIPGYMQEKGEIDILSDPTEVQ